ncbi:PTS system protein [Salmonella enterica subsp. enterica]|uniref:PTS system protein n=1 Tax=Salmonella enterica I TaxID=59201 RepID=A0A3S4IF33_SALET|nr:PTS system protein [Salmonella enterica subsp. enterica]
MDTLLFASLMGLYYWFARLRLGYTFSRDAVTTGGDRGICRAFAWQYADRDDHRRRDGSSFIWA